MKGIIRLKFKKVKAARRHFLKASKIEKDKTKYSRKVKHRGKNNE
jgi:hypothetical protein